MTMKTTADEATLAAEFPTTTIKHVSEYLTAVLGSGMAPSAGFSRPEFVFRGLEDSTHRIVSSLDRLGMKYADGHAFHASDHEGEILDDFGRLSRTFWRQEPRSHWELVALAQHYGLPTRAIDWTYSPLVAAFFATQNPWNGKSRVVWRLHWTEMHKSFFPWRMWPFTAETMEKGMGDEEEGEKSLSEAWWPRDEHPGSIDDQAFLFEPPAIDARIIAQQGVFTVCRNTEMPFDVFLRKSTDKPLLTRIVIPENAIADFRNELAALGVTPHTLFPDVEGVARTVTSTYAEMVRKGLNSVAVTPHVA